MDKMQFTSSIISSIAWPFVILSIAFYFRIQIRKLIENIIRLKIKDVELSFTEKLSDLPTSDNINESNRQIENGEWSKYHKLLDASPKAAVISIYTEIESIAKTKVTELLPELPNKNRAIDTLITTRALNEENSNLLIELRKLRNSAAHIAEEFISKEDGKKYIELAIGLINAINAITRIRKINLNSLTILLFNLNMIVDNDLHKGVSINEIRSHILRHDVLEYLDSKFGDTIDLSIYLKSDVYLNFKTLYGESLESMENAIDFSRKFGVNNNGICALIAMTTQLIQQGEGWIERL